MGPSSSTNPFATRFTRPGAIPPLDASGETISTDDLVTGLDATGNAAAIVGPHGSGKSTLLAMLAGRLAASSRLGGLVRLGDGWCGDVAAVFAALLECGRGRIVCIDGWERLGGCTMMVVQFAAKALGRGLLVTAHRRGTLATLVECTTTPRLLAGIVGRLPSHGGVIDDDDILAAFRAAGGDVREALFLLYDRFEERKARVFRPQFRS